MIYVLDTSSLMVFKNYYPASFQTFWERLDDLVSQERLVSCREVRAELARRDSSEHVADWCANNGDLFTGPTEDELARVAEIFAVAHFQQLVGKKQMLNGFPVADPFVIARAWVLEGCVITEETARPHGARIPNVCEHFGVDCASVEGMIAREGWSF